MGFFTNFIIKGFKKSELPYFSPGVLYEVMSKLGEELRGDQMRSKVCTLLDGWHVPPQSFRVLDQKVPAYALEIHAINEQNHPRNGYGTYVFVPDERNDMVVTPLTSIFSPPLEIWDEEDFMKALAATKADKWGYSKEGGPVVYELSCAEEEFYPLRMWTKEIANDPLEELFGIFDALHPGEYAGVSIVVVPPEDDWNLAGRKRIRSIEDPEYRENIGIIETVTRIFNGDKLPDDEVDRLAVYKKQQLDPHEKEETDLIRSKIDGDDAFRCTIRVYASSAARAEQLAGVIVQKTSWQWNSLYVNDKNSNLLDLAMRREGPGRFHMTANEIASIWHVPAENTSGIKRHRPLPAALTPPDELLTIDIGDPGDIQNLIFSIGSGE